LPLGRSWNSIAWRGAVKDGPGCAKLGATLGARWGAGGGSLCAGRGAAAKAPAVAVA